MKHILLLIMAFSVLFSTYAQSPRQSLQHKYFVQNHGQWPNEVLYLAKIGGLNAWITDFGVVYDYYKIEKGAPLLDAKTNSGSRKKPMSRDNTLLTGHILSLEYEGKNEKIENIPTGKSDSYYNYFVGNDQSKWATNVPLYNEVVLENVYEGIDIRYYFDEANIRYDYKVDAGTGLDRVKLRIDGDDGLSVNEYGELVIQTSLGEVVHGKLFAYQKEWYGAKPVECGFKTLSGGGVGINASGYDIGKELIIDPLVYSTFIGAGGIDEGMDIMVDAYGYPVMCGLTISSGYPVTSGAYDKTHNGGLHDAMVSKFDSTGSGLFFSTFLGGGSLDEAYAITIDASGRILVTGQTESNSFPVTTGALHNGASDAFISCFDPTGTILLFSTLIGGSQYDYGHGIATDAFLNVYITGETYSNDFPTTGGAFDRTFSGFEDAFVLSTTPFGSINYSTYLGGNDSDWGKGICVTSTSGIAYVTGTTYSNDFPTTSGALYESFMGGMTDAFITGFNATGSAIINSTFLGGNKADEGIDIARDSEGNAHVTGNTYSNNFPFTTGAFDSTFTVGYDVFATKLDSSLSTLLYSTFLGGSGTENVEGITIDGRGNAIITGETSSNDFPVTASAFDAAHNGGYYDIFVTRLNSTGTSLRYSSYIGGSGFDYAGGIGYSSSGNAVVTGLTESTNFPTTAGAFDETFNGGSRDVYVTAIDVTVPEINIVSPNGSESLEGGTTESITWNSSEINNIAIEYSLNNGADWYTVVGSVNAADASYNWTVPDSNSSNCLVRLYSLSDTSVGDTSDAIFSIYVPSVTLTEPNGGEIWEAGTAQSITWSRVSVVNVKIEYSTNNGSSWSTIVNSIDAAAGSYNWTVGNTPSSVCYIRVSDASNALVSDESDAAFEIFLPFVTVTDPNGGEEFRAGAAGTITWTSVGIDNVKIEYSTDSGGSWTVIDPSVTGSLGTYEWSVPNVESPTALIRLSDELDPSIDDQSDAVFTIGAPTTTINYSAGWNVLSVPFALDNNDPSTVFPTKTSDVFAYSSGYYAIFGLQPTQGFWVQFGSPGTETLDGQGFSDSTVQVFAGWNLIGTTEYDVTAADISSTPAGIVQSVCYEYDAGYTPVTTLVEGKGYWVKCSQAGELLLPRQTGSPKVEPPLTPEENLITLTVSDAAGNTQHLYIADQTGNFELPPVPPVNIFDVRFGDDSYLCEANALRKLKFQSEDYPLTISVAGGNLKLTDGASGMIINRRLLDGESMTITNKSIGNLNINTVEIPADYVLFQNYPNPFNPVTTIKFGLPQEGKVEITVYNQLGQKVETLISKELEAGYHELEWNAMQYSSGVYLYTIKSGNFKSVKKMLLLK